MRLINSISDIKSGVYYLCYTIEQSEYMNARDNHYLKYMSIFKGHDSNPSFEYMELGKCVGRLITDIESNDYSLLKVFECLVGDEGDNDSYLDDAQNFYPGDIIFELTDDEILDHVVVALI